MEYGDQKKKGNEMKTRRRTEKVISGDR